MVNGPLGDFEGLAALVTGGASGIGAATAAELASRGATVFIFDRTAADALPTGVFGIVGDVTNDHDIAQAIARVGEEAGGLDVVVNNAAMSAVGDVAANDRDEWHRVLDLNVVSAARVVAEALPLLRASASAAIVNVSSFGSRVGIRNRAVYCATKGAIDALTLAMAADHLKDGIRVNAVQPGTADTPWIRRLIDNAPDPAAEEANLQGRQPMGRLVTAQEVAWGICYLASPRSGSTTGTLLPIDAGITGVRV